MPRSTGKILEQNGYQAKDIRDYGLRGSSDEIIYEFAQREKSVILTGDKGFGNISRIPIGTHCGIVLTRFPNDMPTDEINRHIIEKLSKLEEKDFKGNLIVIDSEKIRIRNR
ncbi:MAG: DUF5615 family PIN-like protein [Ignavibacteriae bacterium]|nr:DUF5615 family PIN-like protein [Ignavibacteriota bacterium]